MDESDRYHSVKEGVVPDQEGVAQAGEEQAGEDLPRKGVSERSASAVGRTQ